MVNRGRGKSFFAVALYLQIVRSYGAMGAASELSSILLRRGKPSVAPGFIRGKQRRHSKCTVLKGRPIIARQFIGGNLKGRPIIARQFIGGDRMKDPGFQSDENHIPPRRFKNRPGNQPCLPIPRMNPGATIGYPFRT